MMIRLHKNATTTPAIRASIQASPLSVAALANELGISEDTVRRWKSRDSVEDRPHTAHRLQTTLTPAQGAGVIALRKTLWLPLDDLLVVVREFIHEGMSRSTLHRLLVRHGVSRIPAPVGEKPAYKAFKSDEPGFVPIDVKYLPQMPDEEQRRYLFVAIDRATRWVFVKRYADKTAAFARDCRALQWPDCTDSDDAPLQQCGGLGEHLAPLCLALQPSSTAESAGAPNPHAGHETVVCSKARSVR